MKTQTQTQTPPALAEIVSRSFLAEFNELRDRYGRSLAHLGLQVELRLFNATDVDAETYADSLRDTVEYIAHYVARAYDLRHEALFRGSRQRASERLVFARWVAMLFVQDFLELSDGAVAKYFACDRSILIKARKRIAEFCEIEPKVKQQLAQMRAELAEAIPASKTQYPCDTIIRRRRSAANQSNPLSGASDSSAPSSVASAASAAPRAAAPPSSPVLHDSVVKRKSNPLHRC